MTIGAHALAKLYRGVLDEALAAVRKAGAVDRTAEPKIKDAFGSAIPSIVPASLDDKIDGPTLEAELRSDAAALLFRICQSFPRGEFVAAVAKAAKASIDAFRAQKMANPTIQLLTFKGCPLAPAARESLQKALAELGIPTYQEVGILDSSRTTTPAALAVADHPRRRAGRQRRRACRQHLLPHPGVCSVYCDDRREHTAG